MLISWFKEGKIISQYLWIIKWNGVWKENNVDKVGGVFVVGAETRDGAKLIAMTKIEKDKYRITKLISSAVGKNDAGILSDERFFLMDVA